MDREAIVAWISVMDTRGFVFCWFCFPWWNCSLWNSFHSKVTICSVIFLHKLMDLSNCGHRSHANLEARQKGFQWLCRGVLLSQHQFLYSCGRSLHERKLRTERSMNKKFLDASLHRPAHAPHNAGDPSLCTSSTSRHILPTVATMGWGLEGFHGFVDVMLLKIKNRTRHSTTWLVLLVSPSYVPINNLWESMQATRKLQQIS
jgi:hypothetical protein